MQRTTPATICGLAMLVLSTTACSGGSSAPAPITATSTTAPASATPPGGPASRTPATTIAAATATAAAANSSNACSLITTAQLSALEGKTYQSATPSVIASGQDQCDYRGSGGEDIRLIDYQPNSGVTYAMLISAAGDSSNEKALTGIGDKATLSTIELDVQSGSHLFAITGAGGLASPAEVAAGMSAGEDKAEAVAKAIVANLH